MKFSEYLNEKFSTGAKVGIKKNYVQFFEDPTSDEIKEIIKDITNQDKHKAVRFGVSEDGTLFAWDGNILHAWAYDALKKDHKISSYFVLMLDYDWDDNNFDLSIESKDPSEYENLDMEELQLKLQRALPKARTEVTEFINDLVNNLHEKRIVENVREIDKSVGINKKAVKSIIDFMRDNKLNIDPLPKLRIIGNDEENAKKLLGNTGNYDNENEIITIYTKDRHEQDILRSFTHEMVHHIQNLDGRLKDIDTQNVNKSEELEELEAEANRRGNMIFRSWKDLQTERE